VDPLESDKPKTDSDADKSDKTTPSETFKAESGDLNNMVAESLLKDKAAQEEGESSPV